MTRKIKISDEEYNASKQNGDEHYQEGVNFSKFIVNKANALGITIEEVVTACNIILSTMGMNDAITSGFIVSMCKETIKAITDKAKTNPAIKKSIEDFELVEKEILKKEKSI